MVSQRICSLKGCGKPLRQAKLCWGHYERLQQFGDPLFEIIQVTEPRTFAELAVSSDSGECILWPLATAGGYGQFSLVGGAKVQTHRHVCERVHGAPPSAIHQAAHNCGVRLCINPRHLRWATPKENHADKAGHGTMVLGSKHHRAKLCEGDIPVIRARMAKGEPDTHICLDYGVSSQVIWGIRHGKGWAHVK